MKRWFLLFTALLITFGITFAEEKKYAQASFSKTTHDFGIIKDQPVTTTFEVTNTGNKNLFIYKVNVNCGCTKPSFSKRPIAPGKKSTIKITYVPDGIPSAFRKEIIVITNGNPQKHSLWVEGTSVGDQSTNY